MIEKDKVTSNDILMLGSSVTIIEAEIVGKVDAIIQERTGISYRIKWWSGNTRSSIWCLPDEIIIND